MTGFKTKHTKIIKTMNWKELKRHMEFLQFMFSINQNKYLAHNPDSFLDWPEDLQTIWVDVNETALNMKNKFYIKFFFFKLSNRIKRAWSIIKN